MAFVFMAAATPNGSLLIRDAVAALPVSPWRDASLALLLLGLRAEDRARTGTCVDAARLYGGADPGRGRAQRCRGQGRGDRVHPLSAARRWRCRDGAKRWPRPGCSRPSTAFWSGSRSKTRKRCWPIPASAKWDCWPRRSAWGWPRATPVPPSAASFSATHHVLVKGGLFLAIGVAAAARPAPVAGVDPGGGAGAGPRRAAPYRRRAGEAGAQDGVRRRPRRRARDLVGGRQHIADAPFPALSDGARQPPALRRRRRPASCGPG